MTVALLAFARFFVAGMTGALTAYALYWYLVTAANGCRPTYPWQAPFIVRLHRGAAGFFRLYFGWMIAFTVYGLISTYEAPPWTWDWWYNAILDGDWVVILVLPALFALAIWRRSQPSPRTQND